MKLNSIDNKNKVAVVVVGYKRLNSIMRLLNSLINAKYTCDVPLVISIDSSLYQPLYNYVNEFYWPFGDKYVIIEQKRLGLRDHILSCGDLTKFFKAAVILEDDIFVSEYFYDYVQLAVDKYNSDDRIGGISLYRPAMDGNLPIDFIQDGKDTFAYQNVESWGQCWTERMWCAFREWYSDTHEHDFSNIDMPVFIKNWEKAWSKFYMAFQVETGRFFIYPSVSLTTCFSEAGVHGNNSSIGQTVLLSGRKKYNFESFDSITKYDIYGSNEAIYGWLGLSPKELCINLRGYNNNNKGCRYMLSPYKYPYKICKRFSLSLRPIELNVKYGVEGDGLFLYDTNNDFSKLQQKSFPISLAYYYIRQFNVRILAMYVISYVKDKLLAFLK